MRTLLVDNFDSYTFNLFQLIAAITGTEPIVVRNDFDELPRLGELGVESVVISPGPGHPAVPRDFGLCTQLLLAAERPVLGVCLGHQGIGHLHGGSVAPAPEVMHGRRSRIAHVGRDLFDGVPQDFDAVRYHSLAVREDDGAELERLAWTSDGVCMALRHRRKPLWGLQFHPESILTEHGERLLANFFALARGGRRCPRPNAVSPPGTGSAPRRRPTSRIVREERELGVWIDPARVFVELFGSAADSFWLDSAGCQDGAARYSFMGGFPGGPLSEHVAYRVGGKLTVTASDAAPRTTRGDLLEYLDRRLAERGCEPARLPFAGGWVGYLGYELKADYGAGATHRSHLPDAQLLFADRYIAFDHLARRTYLVALRADDDRSAAAWLDATTERILALARGAHAPVDGAEVLGNGAAPTIRFDLSRGYERYMRDIAHCKRLLREGETYEVCLTNTLTTAPLEDPLKTYLELRRLNPAPYAALLRFGRAWVLSSSPERFLRIDADRNVEAKPIKGTARRAAEPEADRRAATQLRESVKDQAENLMIVDLLRNDLGRVCEVGSVHVPSLMDIESYETVHQMVSTVRGRLRDGARPVDCVRAAFPGGSMTGAPKLRTLEIIDGLEQRPRGVYSGSIGYLGVDGALDLNIVIRTIVNTDQECSIGAGGAIVYGSDPRREFSEMLLKAAPLVKAIAKAACATRPVVTIGGGRRRAPRAVSTL